MIALLLGVLLYLNYWQGLEKKIITNTHSWFQRFAGYYLLYLIPFGVAFLLQYLFYPRSQFFTQPWFWIILLLAPAFFSFRVNFNFQEGWMKQRWQGAELLYYRHCINWIVRVFVLMLPVILIWWIKDRHQMPLYGFTSLPAMQPYWIMLLVMVPVIVLACTQQDFLQYYPKAKVVAALPETGISKWLRYVGFELSYGFDFVSIEFFFRGFLVLALMQVCGTQCIIPIACFYCSIHLGKPMGEAISSFFGGALLGIVAFNTGSIWGGLLVHLGISWMMEIGGAVARKITHLN